MNRLMSIGQVAPELHLSRDQLAYLLRQPDAPELEHGRILGGKRVFTSKDVSRLKEWLSCRKSRIQKHEFAGVCSA